MSWALYKDIALLPVIRLYLLFLSSLNSKNPIQFSLDAHSKWCLLRNSQKC